MSTSMSKVPRFQIATVQNLRDRFACAFLIHSLDSWNGLPREAAQDADVHFSKASAPYDPRYRTVKGPLRKVRKATYKQARRNYSSGVRLCEALGCTKSERDVESFMRCSSCKTNMKRNIYYYSKACQRSDWKTRHKLICGKPISQPQSRTDHWY
ncbi:hypothetical protein C8J56DRAFT_47515 [Mycena floridula]|nr:hypothetical protein C8J56DRAFT_47515 [Mycena floridula]